MEEYDIIVLGTGLKVRVGTYRPTKALFPTLEVNIYLCIGNWPLKSIFGDYISGLDLT